MHTLYVFRIFENIICIYAYMYIVFACMHVYMLYDAYYNPPRLLASSRVDCVYAFNQKLRIILALPLPPPSTGLGSRK